MLDYTHSLRVAVKLRVWAEEHPAEPAEPEWAEELMAAHEEVASKTLQKDDALALCEIIRELAARLPDGLPQFLTGNNDLRGRN